MNLKHIEPVVWLLCGLVLFFALVVIGVAKFMEQDSQTFQIMAGLLTGFGGALLGRIKPGTPDAPPVVPSTVNVLPQPVQPPGVEH